VRTACSRAAATQVVLRLGVVDGEAVPRGQTLRHVAHQTIVVEALRQELHQRIDFLRQQSQRLEEWIQLRHDSSPDRGRRRA